MATPHDFSNPHTSISRHKDIGSDVFYCISRTMEENVCSFDSCGEKFVTSKAIHGEMY